MQNTRTHNTTYTSTFHIVLAKMQGLYDMIGGLWPLLHMQSFEAVTGPKEDSWLVRTVAGILLVVGTVLLRAAFRGHVAHDVRWMAAGISTVLALVALVSSLAGFISWLYFFDGLFHFAFAMAWALGSFIRKPHRITCGME
jgi:hypothetical protein